VRVSIADAADSDERGANLCHALMLALALTCIKFSILVIDKSNPSILHYFRKSRQTRKRLNAVFVRRNSAKHVT
jgi:hypothetical protein